MTYSKSNIGQLQRTVCLSNRRSLLNPFRYSTASIVRTTTSKSERERERERKKKRKREKRKRKKESTFQLLAVITRLKAKIQDYLKTKFSRSNYLFLPRNNLCLTFKEPCIVIY